MTPQEITLARRIIACGLPTPKTNPALATGYIFSLDTGPVPVGGKCEYKRLLFTVVATDNGPELLPVLEDFALLGWLQMEIERILKCSVLAAEMHNGGWACCPSFFTADRLELCDLFDKLGESGLRIEALVAALEAAKGAA